MSIEKLRTDVRRKPCTISDWVYDLAQGDLENEIESLPGQGLKICLGIGSTLRVAPQRTIPRK